MGRLAGFLLLAAALLVAGAAEAATVVGKVSRIEGVAEGTSEGEKRTLTADAPIHLDEAVTTAASARLELTFDDGTVLSLGENVAMTIDRFVYHPTGKLNRLALEVSGPFRFVSGKLSKRPGADVAVTTPVATIGIRGTDFWGGPIDGEFGVFLIVGRVVVANAHGQAVLAHSGEGVNLTGPDAAPGPVSIWPSDKAARALAAVGFQ